MQNRTISHFCQKCLAANPLGQEFCQRCGTRLMLVVQPPSVRVDMPATTPHEEHVLERMTMLENTLARLAERLEQSLKLLLRQSETTYTNHALVKSLIEILNECGVVNNGELESKWRAECRKLDEPTETQDPTNQPNKARKVKRKATTSG
jgi:hypothetical protein